MSPDPDLARRAVACPRWCWMPGMLALVVETFLVRDNGDWCREDGTWGADPPPRWRRRLNCSPEHDDWNEEDGWPPDEDAGYLSPDPLPDLSDPATLGTLLALVREAWGTTAHIVRLQTNVYDGQGGTKPACWWALALGLQSVPFLIDGHRYLAGPTEAEALVAALEAAP